MQTSSSSSSMENIIHGTPNERSSERVIDLVTPMNLTSVSATASARAVDLTNSDNEEEEEDRNMPARDESMDTAMAEDEWSCPRCTLINKNTNPRCDACQYVNHEIQLQRNSSTTRETHGSTQSSEQQQQSSSLGYIGSGALLGAAVGMTGNWVQGRNVFGGALEGGATGAMGGALLHEVLQNNNTPPQPQIRQTTYRRNDNTGPYVTSGRRRSRGAEGRYSSRTRSSSNDNSNYRNGPYTRTSVAAGAVEYSTVDRSLSDISAAGRSYRSRPRYSNDSQAHTNASTGTSRNYPQDEMNLMPYRQVEDMYRDRAMRRNNDTMIRNRNLLLRERIAVLRALNQQLTVVEQIRDGNNNIDSMNYEQLLNAFGDGTENMGANEHEIGRLPTHTVGDQPLPEDARQCLICLEDFEKGETRTILPCLHGFHKDCCHKWLKTNGKCPICKHPISSNGG